MATQLTIWFTTQSIAIDITTMNPIVCRIIYQLLDTSSTHNFLGDLSIYQAVPQKKLRIRGFPSQNGHRFGRNFPTSSPHRYWTVRRDWNDPPPQWDVTPGQNGTKPQNEALQGGAPNPIRVQLVQISPRTMVYRWYIYIELVDGIITHLQLRGAPPCRDIWLWTFFWTHGNKFPDSKKTWIGALKQGCHRRTLGLNIIEPLEVEIYIYIHICRIYLYIYIL